MFLNVTFSYCVDETKFLNVIWILSNSFKNALRPAFKGNLAGVQPQQDPGVPSGETALVSGKREREWHGETKLWSARPITLFSKGIFIPWLVHRGKWKMQGHTESAQTLQQFCPYRNQDFFLHTFPINNVVYIIFWPWKPVNILWPSFDKGCSTRKLIFPWNVFSLYF